MKPQISLPVLITSVLIAAAATPGSIAAQHAESSKASAAESVSERRARTSPLRHITADDITKSKAHNAYEIVSRHRPQWLRRRGVSSMVLQGGIRVYLDERKMGGIEELRDINADMIGSIQYLDGVEATLRFGTGNGDGAILISTRF